MCSEAKAKPQQISSPNQYCINFSDLGDGWNVALLETEEEYYFISVNHNSLDGDSQYFIGGSLPVDEDYYDEYVDYGGTYIFSFARYSTREGGVITMNELQ